MFMLKELRKMRFLSQDDLAKKSNITASTINRLERGKQNPRYVTIRKLAKALEVEPKDIDFQGKEDG